MESQNGWTSKDDVIQARDRSKVHGQIDDQTRSRHVAAEREEGDDKCASPSPWSEWLECKFAAGANSEALVHRQVGPRVLSSNFPNKAHVEVHDLRASMDEEVLGELDLDHHGQPAWLRSEV